jgi:hypothetical protein
MFRLVWDSRAGEDGPPVLVALVTQCACAYVVEVRRRQAANVLAIVICHRYLMSVSILNIGRYIEITIVPTMTPTPIIRIGSMMDVSDWMLESTSSS